MRDWRWMLLVLALLLGWLQYRFWFGPGNSGEVMMLEAQVANQERDNEGLQQRNDALAAEVKDLKEGQSAIEERARSELGMIKPGEKFYRVVEDAPVPGAACGRCQCAGWRPPGGRHECGDLGRGSGCWPWHPLRRAVAQAVPAGGRADPARPYPGRPAGASGRGRGDGGDRPGRRRLARLERWAGKPVLTCIGGATRAASVLAGLQALPETVRADEFVLVHDAARPNLSLADLGRLLEVGRADPVGAILAAPVRDTLKRAATTVASMAPSRASACGAR
jgi:cell division protein FtsB